MGISPKDFQTTLNKYFDFHRPYLFKVYFFNSTEIISLTNLNSVFVTDLISASETPVSTSTQLPVGWMGSKLKVAGKTDFQDWKVTVRDDLTNLAYNYFQQWREEVYNLQNGLSEGLQNVGYKRSAAVHLLGKSLAAGALNPIGRVYILHGIWPKDIGATTLDYSTENICTFPVNFSVDYYTFEPNLYNL